MKRFFGDGLLVAFFQNAVGFDTDQYLPTLHCMENSDDPMANAKKCLKQNLPQISFKDVNSCTKVTFTVRLQQTIFNSLRGNQCAKVQSHGECVNPSY